MQLCAPVNTLQWRHNKRNGVSNHHPYGCLLNCLFRGRSKKISKLRVTGLCEGNWPVTGEFPTQRASNAKKLFPFDDVSMGNIGLCSAFFEINHFGGQWLSIVLHWICSWASSIFIHHNSTDIVDDKTYIVFLFKHRCAEAGFH